jgi:Domain of unknown function (DUF4062)
MQKIVYISSTYKDLVAYRSAIRDMFLSKGLNEEYDVVGMEGYVSENGKRAIDVCLEDVRAADIYILILAKRYGSVVEGTGISYTETEYNEALKMKVKKPNYKIFVFYSNDEMEQEDFAATKNLGTDGLEKFYNSVLNNSAAFIYPFTNPDNLCKQILLTFSYNFKAPSSLTDYREALMLIDRNEQSYSFSKSVRRNTNSFYFSSVYENSPNDFLERLHDLEMGGKYSKCRIDLGQFTSTVYEKFKETFIAELTLQWGKEVSDYTFSDIDKLFLSVEINSVEANSDMKIEFINKVLAEFLPHYLTAAGKSTSQRVFFIFYTYLAAENAVNEKFDALIKSLLNSVSVNGCLANINPLNDITKTDARNWLDVFVKSHSFNEDDIDEMLQVQDNPFKKFKMKEMNRCIRKWMTTNLFTN